MKRPRLPRWLYPGMHLKRWLLLVFYPRDFSMI